jgi:hypothetical protein
VKPPTATLWAAKGSGRSRRVGQLQAQRQCRPGPDEVPGAGLIRAMRHLWAALAEAFTMLRPLGA